MTKSPLKKREKWISSRIPLNQKLKLAKDQISLRNHLIMTVLSLIYQKLSQLVPRLVLNGVMLTKIRLEDLHILKIPLERNQTSQIHHSLPEWDICRHLLTPLRLEKSNMLVTSLENWVKPSELIHCLTKDFTGEKKIQVLPQE